MSGPTGDLYILYPDPPLPRLPLVVTEIGASWWPAGHSHQRDRSAILAMELVRSGQVRLVQDGRETRIGPNEMFTLRRDVRHRYVADAGPVRKRFIGFAGVLAEQFIASLPDRIVPAHVPTVEGIFDRIEGLFRKRPRGWQRTMAGEAYHLCAELTSSLPEHGGGDLHPAVELALRLIHEQGRSQPSITWLAQRAGVSPTHLNRLFLAALGTTPARYARRCIMDQACFLLGSSTLSCQVIAKRLGFDDPLYFSKVFHRTVGQSPSAYRRRHA